MSTSPGRYNLKIYQGATLDKSFTWKDDAGDTVDLSNAAMRLQIRKDHEAAEVLWEATSDGDDEHIVISDTPDDGSWRLVATAEETAALDFDRAVYDLEVEFTTGLVVRLLEGSASVSREVTR